MFILYPSFSLSNMLIQTSSLDLVYPKYMLFCVVVASLNFFCIGWVTGSANLPGAITHSCKNGIAHIESPIFPDCLPMGEALWGFAVASFCVGALLGGLSGGYIQTKLGRRKTIFFNSFGYIVGGILIGCSTSSAMFIMGRIICGLSCGLGSLTVPIYVGEISTVKSRGVMGTINQLMACAGVVISCIVGLPLSHVSLWRINYALVIIPALLQTFLMPFCIESPRYLVSINRLIEAKEGLQKLRPDSDINVEFYAVVESLLGSKAAMEAMAKPVVTTTAGSTEIDYFKIESKSDTKTHQLGEPPLSTPPLPTPPPIYTEGSGGNTNPVEAKTPMHMIQIFCDPFIRQIALIVILAHCFQQLIGINAVMYYSTSMFAIVFSLEMSKYMLLSAVQLTLLRLSYLYF